MSNLEKARAAWTAARGHLPDWVARLAEECDRASQTRVAARLGRSASLVSTVLAGSYKGDLAAVEEIVRGVFLGGTVACPAQGTISTAACREWMRLAGRYSNESSARVRMYRACRRCPRYLKEDRA